MKSLQLLVTVIVISGAPAAGAGTQAVRSAASEVLEQGWQAYQSGRFPEALSAYVRAVELAPDNGSLWYDVGCLYALTGEPAHAQDALSYALHLLPGLADAYDALGQLHDRAGRVEAAYALYTTAALLEPTRSKYLRHRIRALIRLDQLAAAQRALPDLLLFAPDDRDARYVLGVLELRTDAPELAIHNFKRILARTPDDVMAWNGLGLAHIRIGALQEAAEALTRARTLAPRDARTASNLGVLAAAQHRWEDARHAWEDALAIEPAFAPALHNLELIDAP